MDEKLQVYMEPFLKENKLSNRDFDNLFGSFDEGMLSIVLDYFTNNDIEIISKHKDKNRVLYNDRRKISLTNEELCVMYQRGDELALDALIEKNKGLVYSRVMIYINSYNHDLSVDDLFQEGSIGLVKAANRFDNSLGFKLTTYATSWIDQGITRAIADKGFTIRIPVHMFDKINKLNRIYRDTDINGLSYNETRNQVMQKMNVDKEQLDEMLVICHNIVSMATLNIPIGESGDTQLGDIIEDYLELNTFDIVAEDLLKIDLEIMLDTLGEREEDIISMRYGLGNGEPHTLEEIGQFYGVTRERIRQIEAKALRKLRHPSRSKRLRGYLYEE